MNEPDMMPKGGGPQGPQQTEEPQAGGNPVIAAFETLAKFIAAQSEQGNPQAAALQDWLQKGIQLLTGGGQQEQEKPPMQEKPEPEGPQEMTRDINAGKGAAKVL